MSKNLIAPQSEGIVEKYVHQWGKAAFIERFRLPNGKPHDFLTFGSMLPSPPLAAVVIFPLTTDGKVITAEQFRYGANAFVKELPGGCPDGESPEETIRRELLDETGYQAGRLIELKGSSWFEPASLRARYGAFLALDCTFVQEATPEEDEIMKTVLYPLDEWMRMIDASEIEDDKSIAVTWRALAYLGWKFQPPK